jgi:hypothetical protein
MKKLLFITLFAIAMGFLESAVVIYLRELYYPKGFCFPLSAMNATIVTTELWRELATIIMLIGIGYLASEQNKKRFAWFIYSFAIWDIFYYVFLYLILKWPTNLLAWDVLFLLPMMWTGPVYSPLLICCSMIVLAFLVLNDKSTFNRINTSLMLLGTIICLVAFMLEFFQFHLAINNLNLSADTLIKTGYLFIPNKFPLPIFIIGFSLLNIGIYLTLNAHNHTKTKNHVQLFI